MIRICVLLVLCCRAFLCAGNIDTSITLNQVVNGYRGIWYSNQPSGDEYVYKYSGGLGTYPANHYPFSVYSPEVNKTFFCYGGTDAAGKTLLHMVSYFDHKTGKVPRPTLVLDKKTNDAHDNPVLNIDQQGYLWLFSTSHGTSTVSYVHKSKKPYDISEFERVPATKQVNGTTWPLDNFSYLQAWVVPDSGFLNLFTHYDRKVIPGQPSKPRRTISYMKSKDGLSYGEWMDIAAIEEGHYQTSGQWGKKLATSFNYHPIKPKENGLNYRTNLYYLETSDFGNSWQNAKGETVSLPVAAIDNPALVKDYAAEGKLVYINDLAFTAEGHPVILYITSTSYEAGPKSGPQEWFTAAFTGTEWQISKITESDNNYDMGSLYIESDGSWVVVGPTATGPQAYNTGGEIVQWESNDAGQTWRAKQLTSSSLYNHCYPRKPVRTHPDFYAFWADGHGRQPSESRLYFSDREGRVYQLPVKMKKNQVKPRRIR
ncbi:BNR-4 repeat-containing protein [Flavihumibacter cheonanensis]|uniref:BNR-4 repeat-containing protein n=1 Tax=Flavihumibacter cheonanensis TaxID=1442385 RepID=UPI001EF93D9C|nr:BNR-4 repeat-containing protein [Flavihumibacter cheonanensis]MCG7752602.1 BNR repeat-containing protein [Flavihumibacter cheonanensis]